MLKTKVFLGTVNHQADERFNYWIVDHPNISILSFEYKMTRFGDHAICILYEEKNDDKN